MQHTLTPARGQAIIAISQLHSMLVEHLSADPRRARAVGWDDVDRVYALVKRALDLALEDEG